MMARTSAYQVTARDAASAGCILKLGSTRVLDGVSPRTMVRDLENGSNQMQTLPIIPAMKEQHGPVSRGPQHSGEDTVHER